MLTVDAFCLWYSLSETTATFVLKDDDVLMY
jgi:hypothetical protein